MVLVKSSRLRGRFESPLKSSLADEITPLLPLGALTRSSDCETDYKRTICEMHTGKNSFKRIILNIRSVAFATVFKRIKIQWDDAMCRPHTRSTVANRVYGILDYYTLSQSGRAVPRILQKLERSYINFNTTARPRVNPVATFVRRPPSA